MVCRSYAGAFSASWSAVVDMYLIVCAALEQAELLGRVRRREFVHTKMVFNDRKYGSVPLCCCGIMLLALVLSAACLDNLQAFCVVQRLFGRRFGATEHGQSRRQSGELSRYVALRLLSYGVVAVLTDLRCWSTLCRARRDAAGCRSLLTIAAG